MIEALVRWQTINKSNEFPDQYIDKVNERILWQLTEAQVFVACMAGVGGTLAESPIEVPSGRYEETLKLERTEADVINEISRELASLPRFTAFAKVLQKIGQKQVVIEQKVKTQPLPVVDKWLSPEERESKKRRIEVTFLESCQERRHIGEQIRRRRQSGGVRASPTHLHLRARRVQEGHPRKSRPKLLKGVSHPLSTTSHLNQIRTPNMVHGKGLI